MIGVGGLGVEGLGVKDMWFYIRVIDYKFQGIYWLEVILEFISNIKVMGDIKGYISQVSRIIFRCYKTYNLHEI